MTIVALTIAASLLYFFFVSPYRVYIVHTGSMGQTIPSRSAVFVQEGEYKVGQVVTFKMHGEVVTHRLVSIGSDGNITTKGDANASEDTTHPPTSDIIGGVVKAPKHLGWMIVFFKQPSAWLMFISAGLCIWMIWSPYEEPTTESESEPEAEPLNA